MVNYFQCAQLSKFQIEFNIKFVNDEMYRVMASLCSTQPASEWNRTKKTKWLFDSCHKTGPSVRTNLPEDPIWWPFSNPSSISSSGKPAVVLHSNPIEVLSEYRHICTNELKFVLGWFHDQVGWLYANLVQLLDVPAFYDTRFCLLLPFAAAISKLFQSNSPKTNHLYSAAFKICSQNLLQF